MKKQKFCTFHFVFCNLNFNKKAFTLIELLAVLLLLSLASLIAIPSIDGGLKRREIRRSVLQLAAVARSLRRQAIDEGAPKSLTLSPKENSYLASGAEIVRLPDAIKISAVAGGEPIGDRLSRFFFFPNGSIVGGRIELSSSEGSVYAVSFEPLTGRVVVTRP